jgi:hypothetical protein
LYTIVCISNSPKSGKIVGQIGGLKIGFHG